MKKRLTAAALVLCMLLTIAPVNVWAAGGTDGIWFNGGNGSAAARTVRAPRATADDTPSAADSAEKLQELFNNETISNIQLQAGESILLAAGSASLMVPKGRKVTLDLNGVHINSFISVAVIVEGSLTVKDSTAAADQLRIENDKVPYQFGSITTGNDDTKRDAIRVRNGGTFILESGTVSATNIAICADGVIGGTGEPSQIAVDGGYVRSREFAVLVRGEGAKAEITGGILWSEDNAVIGGNGLAQYAGTEIEMSGGILVSRITTPGYIPCGIYHPQRGTVNITGGEIRAEGGVGVLLRGGSLDVGDTVTGASFIVNSAEGVKGKVGDAGLAIEAGDAVAMDRQSGYYDSANMYVIVPTAEEALAPTAYHPEALDLVRDIQDDGRALYTLEPKEPVACTVTFNYNYTGAPAPITARVNEGSKLAKPADPARAGYTFGGWYREAACTTAWNFGADTVTGNTTLYAKWTPVAGEYTITFDANGGTLITGGTSATMRTGSDGKLPAAPPDVVPRPGYTFQGWYTEGGTAVNQNRVFTRDTTAYARWTRDGEVQTYTVTFYLDESGGAEVYTTRTVAADQTIQWPEDPKREGYTFQGWFADDNTRYNEGAHFTFNTFLYARWTQDSAPDTPETTYTITFHLNYTDAPADKVPAPVKTGKDGIAAEPEEVPQRSGYTFAGWYTAAEGGEQADFSKPFSADTDLYAHWVKGAERTIKFDANGGTLSGDSTVTTTGGKLASLPTPTREGYTFDGWYTAASGGTKVTTNTTFPANTTVYAHWTRNGTEDPDTPSSSSRHRIYTPDRTSGGTFEVSHTRAAEGTRVTIELSPRSSFELDKLEVTDLDTGRVLRLTERSDDEYTFTMPDSDVEIEITFSRRYSTVTAFPQEPAAPLTGWYYRNGSIYTAAGELVPSRAPLTRDMLLSIFYNQEGGGREGHIIWASNAGVIPDYYESGLYGPDKALSREQAAVLLYGYAGYKGYNTSQRATLRGYSDYTQVRTAAQGAMSWARATGLMTGTSDTTLSPQSTLSCGQACILLQRFSRFALD